MKDEFSKYITLYIHQTTHFMYTGLPDGLKPYLPLGWRCLKMASGMMEWIWGRSHHLEGRGWAEKLIPDTKPLKQARQDCSKKGTVPVTQLRRLRKYLSLENRELSVTI
jgi:hypothetical protein